MIRFKTWLPLALAIPAVLAGCSKDEKQESGPAAPSIVYFYGEPENIEIEMFSTLAWSTKDASAIRIVDMDGNPIDLHGAKAKEGAVDVFPSRSTAYFLTATGPGGTASAAFTVQVAPPGKPELSLKITPAAVPFGSEATLTWSAKDATHAQVFEGEKRLIDEKETFAGTLKVSPTRSVAYRLIADGAGGREVVELPVNVVAAIASFTADATGPVVVGAEVELSWETKGAHKIVISNEADFVRSFETDLDKGSVVAPVGDTGKFVLTAFRDGKESTKEVTVELLTAPRIRAFEVDRPFVTEASEDDPVSVVLTWEIDGAEDISLTAEPGGDIVLDDAALSTGTLAYEVTGTTTFTLTVGNAAGTNSRTIDVMSVAAPEIAGFAADTLLVGEGDEFMLVWETNGGAELIEGEDGEPMSVEAIGSLLRTIDETTQFTLRATNPAGDFVEQTIEVEVGAPEIADFSAEDTVGAPGEEISVSWLTRGAREVRVLDPNGEEVCAAADRMEKDSGACSITLPMDADDHVYTLEAINGTDRAEMTLTISVADPV